MRFFLGLPALTLLTACGGGSIELGEDTQRTCPAARVDVQETSFDDARLDGPTVAVVTFRNGCRASNGDLALTLHIEGDDGFTAGVTEVSIAPGESQTVEVSYLPLGYADAVGKLVADTNDPDAAQLTIDLTGSTLADQDGDGHLAIDAGGDDCDDTDAAINPSAEEIWYDGVDQNCDAANDNDQDGDGHSGGPDGADCDDVKATVNPGASEYDNLVDDDCDGWIDENFVRPNDILITEIMADPVAAFDTAGEWFELYNISGRTINLRNWRVTDYRDDSFDVYRDLIIAPGQRIVLTTNADASQNGGVASDLEYRREQFELDNVSDVIALEVAGNTVAMVEYNQQWGVEPGASLALDDLFATRASASLGKNWCSSLSSLAGGDLGTPGSNNDECSSVDHDGDGISIDDGDCDDASAHVFPGAPELWNDIDDDCDGIDDNAKVANNRVGYVDGVGTDYLGHWNSLSTGDIDGDGDMELMVGTINQRNSRSGVVYTLDPADAKTWYSTVDTYAEATIDTAGTYDNGGVMGKDQADVTGDGAVDLVIAGNGRFSGNAVSVYSDGSNISGSMDGGDADAYWTGGMTIDYLRVVSDIDMDADGVAEILYSDPQATHGSFYSSGVVYLIDADGASGGYSLAEDHESMWGGGGNLQFTGSAMTSGDLDADGYDDAVICGMYADFTVVNGGGCAIVSGSKTRVEGGVIDEQAVALIGASAQTDRIGSVPTLVLADFDGDTELDLVVPSPASERVFVFFSAGDLDGTYDVGDADVVITTSGGPIGLGSSIGSGDLDGDGIADLAVGAPDSTSFAGWGADTPGRIWVWSGDTLTANSKVGAGDAEGWVDGEFTTGGFGWALLVADLDADGVDDLVASEPNYNTGSGRVSVMMMD